MPQLRRIRADSCRIQARGCDRHMLASNCRRGATPQAATRAVPRTYGSPTVRIYAKHIVFRIVFLEMKQYGPYCAALTRGDKVRGRSHRHIPKPDCRGCHHA
eukprot:196217-Chlamydomonas_euryale.AAC.6